MSRSIAISLNLTGKQKCLVGGRECGPQVRIRLNYETIMIWFSLTFSTVNFCIVHANGYPHATVYRSDRSGPAFDTIFPFHASLVNLKNSTIDKNFRARCRWELWDFLKIGRCRVLFQGYILIEGLLIPTQVMVTLILCEKLSLFEKN